MSNNIQNIFQDNVLFTGLILLALSFAAFTGTVNIYDIDFDIFSNLFFFNFGLTFIYFIIVFLNNKKTTNRYFRFSNFAHNIVLLQLFNISAYALNRNMSVFQISTNWLVWFLLFSNIVLLGHSIWRNHNNTWFNHLVVMVSSVSILFHLYESIYVFQGYLFGFLGFWFFGISLHIFVPALFVWAHSKVVRGFFKTSNQFWGSALLGWSIALGTVALVSVRFYHVNYSIKEVFHQEQKPYQDNSLPAWLTTSQVLKKDWITERALKCGMIYSEADDIFNTIDGTRLTERIKHDPLVVIASFFSDGIDISDKDKIKILRYMYDARHQTERKLWRGDNLSTTDIVTNVQLFPEYRLAYTEKTFKIKNSQVERWRQQQEALYTFYLPEGSVVTSAALWVNGKEEPAYLTTKSKADSAYKKIVGVERRDPLLLHWQEGNRVTVRVFPCTPKEDRQFKIGVTTPLQKKGNQLTYENIDFEGPYWKGANESINIVSQGTLNQLDAPFSFNKNGMDYTYMGRYKSDWKLTFDAAPLSNQTFSFNGKSYQLDNLEPQEIAFDAQEIYLDINAAWTKKEFNKIYEATKDKKLWVHSNNRMEQVTQHNKKALYKHLRRQNFALFPFYKISNPSQALVISKYNQLTPTLSDLEKTSFVEAMSGFFKENTESLRLYNLDEEISPYLRTLKEFRSIQLENGDLSLLIEQLAKKSFTKNQEDEQSIVNQYAQFKITESQTPVADASAAPDHLMRLFAYNDILREIGKDFFNKKALQTELIDAAKESYVVTPISSLIVLESQADYERFDIKKSKNSLQNASISNSGAVPEPHEWLLIILVFLMTVYLYWKR